MWQTRFGMERGPSIRQLLNTMYTRTLRKFDALASAMVVGGGLERGVPM